MYKCQYLINLNIKSSKVFHSFQDAYYLVPTQEPGFPNECEHISEKRQRAHRQMYTSIYLLEHVINSLDLNESKILYPQILDYMVRVQEVVSKYCKVFFKYNVNKVKIESNQMDETEMKQKIITMCKFITALCKFIKVRVSVTLKDCPQALDMIHKIFGKKITYRIQEYLVHINYWVTTFSPEEQKKYNL